MKQQRLELNYEVYEDISELPEADAALLREARGRTIQAYAPYSNFHVAAVARMHNGKIVVGTNQENASYPVGICAERVLLGSAANLYPGEPIDAVAVTYASKLAKSDHPISPCGMCRQTLAEFETRLHQPIRLILGGMEGKVLVFPSASNLLPFAFSGTELVS
ncbi:MAG TPA: cytidine deaminase [Chitinophagaceae bacterium]|nr:cytidine deaminase [Chitinophagaceae bacterium]